LGILGECLVISLLGGIFLHKNGIISCKPTATSVINEISNVINKDHTYLFLKGNDLGLLVIEVAQ
jgi:hypothetical protein